MKKWHSFYVFVSSSTFWFTSDTHVIISYILYLYWRQNVVSQDIFCHKKEQRFSGDAKVLLMNYILNSTYVFHYFFSNTKKSKCSYQREQL